MSPSAHIAYNAEGLLCGYPGEEPGEAPTFVWTYSTFEKFLDECVTPSMYHSMAAHVADYISKDDLWDIQGDEYCAGDLEAAAVDAYFNLPINDRITRHEQEIVNIQAEKRLVEARESAAIDAMLEENKPFGNSSPISEDYSRFMRELIAKSRETINRLECELHEESQWRGGHEAGAENDAHLHPFDLMDEL
jgi:hypothetical protein